MADQDPWSKPSEIETAAPEDQFDFDDHVGDLLLITPTKYDADGIDTTFAKNRDRLVANIAVVNTKKPRKSEVFTDVWVFQGRLIGKCKGKVGRGMVLGRLVQEPTNKGNPAFDLAEPDEDDERAAREFYATQSPAF